VFAALNQSIDTGSEAPQIAGLRADSNYLTPRLGLLSPDTWAVVALSMRNLVLNWLIYGPLFLAVLLVPSVARAWIEAVIKSSADVGTAWAERGAVLALIAASTAVLGRLRRSGTWLTTTRFVLVALIPAILAAACFTLAAAAAGEASGIAFWALGGAVIYLLSQAIGLMLAGKGRRMADGPLTAVIQAVVWAIAGGLVGCALGLGAAATGWVLERGGAALLAVLGVQWCLLAVFLGELVFVALTSFLPHSDMDREWLARAGGLLAAAAASWSGLAALGLYGPGLLDWAMGRAWTELTTAGIGGLSGAVTLVLGSSGKSAAVPGQARVPSLLMTVAPSVAGVVFIVFLAMLLAAADVPLSSWLLTRFWQIPSPVLTLAAAVAVLTGFAFLMSVFVNVNRFSLHSLYRNRLVRAFLGSAKAGEANATADRDPFTGFNQDDNVYMARTRTAPPGRLLHVVNIALNVVSSRDLAWQERKAEPFTVTRLASGNPAVGYRNTAQYGGKHGLTLGTAMAVSGAAVSPNMGYHSSPVVSFLLMLFNLRLGWWLGNPARDSYGRSGPVPSIVAQLNELAGKTTDAGRWVYLSDGGHFENLGLYEMVRRRCRMIVVSDAGADPKCTFEDLGNAVRKVFIDMGVSVDFRELIMAARQDPPVPSLYCAIGTIAYPGSAEPGRLLYVKPGYSGTERVDIRSYANAHPDFPHESTLDQWFSESQFEAYRALGAHVFEEIGFGGPDAPTLPVASLEEFFGRAEAYLAEGKARGPGPCVR
jgi:hypothetical protein